MSKEAMKLALEALRFALHVGFDESSESQIKKGDKAVQQHQKAITALREALAEQPAQQEPVAWMDIDENGTFSHLRYWSESDNRHEVALYTSPPAQQEPVALKQGECWPEDVMQMWDYYRREIANGNTGSEPRDWFESLAEMRLVDTPPAQRKPLTDEEIYKIANDLFYGNGPCDTLAMCRAIEAAHGIKGEQHG